MVVCKIKIFSKIELSLLLFIVREGALQLHTPPINFFFTSPMFCTTRNCLRNYSLLRTMLPNSKVFFHGL